MRVATKNLDTKKVFEKLRFFFEVKTNAELARLLNIPYKKITSWIYRNTIPYPTIIDIAKKYEISLDWLLFDKKLSYSSSFDLNYSLIPMTTPKMILDKNNKWVFDKKDILGYYAFKNEWLKKMNIDPDEAVLVTFINDTMSPDINKNDVILIDLKDKEILEGKIYAIAHQNTFTLKIIEFQFPDKIILKNSNLNYPPATIMQKEIKNLNILGMVKWVAREL